jgi:hypothetical protein
VVAGGAEVRGDGEAAAGDQRRSGARELGAGGEIELSDGAAGGRVGGGGGGGSAEEFGFAVDAAGVALGFHPRGDIVTQGGEAGGVGGIGGEIAEFEGIGAEVVELLAGALVVAADFGGGGGVVFRGIEPTAEIGGAVGGFREVDVGGEAKFGVQVADVFPVGGAHAAGRVDVERAVGAVGGEHAVAMVGGLAAEDRNEGAAVESGGRGAAGEIDEGGQNIHPGDHRVGAGAGAYPIGPDGDQRGADAGVVEVPLAEGPLGAVVAGVEENGVGGAEDLAGGVEDGAELGVHVVDGGVVTRAGVAGLGGIDVGRGNRKAGGIVGRGILRPRDVRPIGADDEAERLGAGAGAEPSDRVGDGDVVVEGVVREVVEAVVGGVFVVGDFAEGDDLVAERLEVGGEFLEVGAGFGVVGLGAVARGHEAGEERGATRGATRRGDEGAVEHEAGGGDALHVGRVDVFGAVDGGIEEAVVVGEEEDEIGARGGGGMCGGVGATEGEEQREQTEEGEAHGKGVRTKGRGDAVNAGEWV